MHREIRRQDRAASQEDAWLVLSQGEYGVLSTVSAEGQPYGTPFNYCLLDGCIYFHCALEGHVLDNLAANNQVSFCVVGETRVLPEQFATEYKSTVVFGQATEVFEQEKHQALVGLVEKYSQDFGQEGLQYIEKLADRAKVFKVSSDSITGKARRP
jgi:uncharacterized protein